MITNTTISSNTNGNGSNSTGNRDGNSMGTDNATQSSLYDYFDVYSEYEKSDCRVSSNDPSRKEKSIQSDLKICNFTQYTCISTSVGADTRVPVQVPYEYELHYNADMVDDLNTHILPYLEESMLQQIAKALGIAQCRQRRLRLERQQRRTRRHRQLQPSVTQERFTEETGRFAGASLEPRDVWNDRCGNCKANNSYVADGDECLPIRGEMTVLVQLTPQEQAQQLVVTEDDKETIRDAVAMFIKEAMDNDALVVSDYIAKVVYHGDSESKCGGGVLAVDAIAANGGLDGSTGGWSKASRIGLWACLALLLLLLLTCCCCCFCCRRRRRRRRQEQQQDTSASPDGTVSASRVNQQRGLSRGVAGAGTISGRRSPSRSVVAPAPYWGTLSVDDDGEDGIERCLAGRDSLALRQGHSESVKPSHDDESVGTTRTSLASGSVVQREAPDSPQDVHEQPEDEQIETLEDSMDQVPKEITRRVAGEEPVNLETPLPKSSNIKAEDFELLDRLAAAQGPWSDMSVPGEGRGGSSQRRDFMAAASLSPTNASQVTTLASNIQRPSSQWNRNESASTVRGQANHVSMSGNESNTRAIEDLSRGAIDIEQPFTPSVGSRSRQAHTAAPDLVPIVTAGLLTANMASQATSNHSTKKSSPRDETGSSPVASPRTPTQAARDEKGFSHVTRTPPYESTSVTSSPLASPRTPTRAGYETSSSSVASPRTPTRLETIEPPMMYSPQTPKGSMATMSNHAIDAEIRAFAGNIRYPKYTTSNSRTSHVDRSVEGGESSYAGVAPNGGLSKTFRSSTISRSRDAPPLPAQPENHETYTYTPPQHTFSSSAYYQRSSTNGSQVTAVAGNLASSTYGSHTTLRTGNLGAQHNGSNSRKTTDVTYLEEDEEYQDGETAYVPDSFDEEIMGIITEDPSEDNFSGEVVHPTNPDILDGHDAYPDPDGPGMNDAYLSDDSDSVPLPLPEHHYRSVAGSAVANEHAKRRLQMS